MKIVITDMTDVSKIQDTEIELPILHFLSLKTSSGAWNISEKSDGSLQISSKNNIVSIIMVAANTFILKECLTYEN